MSNYGNSDDNNKEILKYRVKLAKAFQGLQESSTSWWKCDIEI